MAMNADDTIYAFSLTLSLTCECCASCIYSFPDRSTHRYYINKIFSYPPHIHLLSTHSSTHPASTRQTFHPHTPHIHLLSTHSSTHPASTRQTFHPHTPQPTHPHQTCPHTNPGIIWLDTHQCWACHPVVLFFLDRDTSSRPHDHQTPIEIKLWRISTHNEVIG